ncbi:MAG: alpha/beta fold hydrolase, partial [Candidatus Woesebacteria bacterium]|nr:alpha/beta fold hydrolase [Candidatus Woesebacteria bacterium]
KIWNSRPEQKIDLVGHSLGGLVARIFAQKNKDKVNKIISVASPHLGVVQVYKPVEAGEIDRENTFIWLAEKIILILNKSAVESDRVTITNKFPVLKNLFPTFNFLKNTNGDEIPVSSLSVKNNLLSSYNQSLADIFSIFTSLYGEESGETPAGFIVRPADILNLALGNYSDGQPDSSLFGAGDTTVLSNSAVTTDNDSVKFNFDHAETKVKKPLFRHL